MIWPKPRSASSTITSRRPVPRVRPACSTSAAAGAGCCAGSPVLPASSRPSGSPSAPLRRVWIRRDPRPGIEVREENWRDHRPDQPYDAIISIGAFEHFVHPGMGGAEKLEAYREFFAWCDGVLVPGGRLSLQTIAYPAPPSETVRRQSAFIAQRIFPGKRSAADLGARRRRRRHLRALHLAQRPRGLLPHPASLGAQSRGPA